MKKRNKVNAEFNMSSLTDIIFLLLIFFMLTASLTSPNLKNLERPQSSSTTPSPQNIALSVTLEGEYFIENDLVPFEELDIRMDQRIKEERKINEEKNIEEEVTIVLNVAAKEPTSTIVKVMALANKHNARLILATDP